MFLEFFYLLRARGLEVSINEWMILDGSPEQGNGPFITDGILSPVPEHPDKN